MNEPKKHHFLPEFYLKNWTNKSGKLVQFSAPYKNIIKAKRTYPGGTGYVDRLYTLEGFDGATSQEIEKLFLSPVDSNAALALQAMHNGSEAKSKERQAWAKFLVTLLFRTPAEVRLVKSIIMQTIAEIEGWLAHLISQHVPDHLQLDALEGLEEIKKQRISQSFSALINIMSGTELTDRIAGMKWAIIDLSHSTHSLLTSDRPVVVDKIEDGSTIITIISIPVAPKKLFVAATEEWVLAKLKSDNVQKITKAINTSVVSFANDFVYGPDETQIRFIQNRFGKYKNNTIVHNILQNAQHGLSGLSSQLTQLMDEQLRNRINAALNTFSSQVHPADSEAQK